MDIGGFCSDSVVFLRFDKGLLVFFSPFFFHERTSLVYSVVEEKECGNKTKNRTQNR